MTRNAESIRQWRILTSIDGSRLGRTIDELSDEFKVSSRTIRRDIEALSLVGFPLYEDEEARPKRFRLDDRPLKSVQGANFTLPEACALYFSRTLIDCFAGSPFREEVARAFEKLARALEAPLRGFMDAMPTAIVVKTAAQSRLAGPEQRQLVARIVDAILNRRAATMQYHSFASRRVKEYEIEPAQLVYGLGALYLLAYVPAYAEVRTFAVDRIQRFSPSERRFERQPRIATQAFPNSLGIHNAPPTRVVLEFHPDAARYVGEREWHASQRVREEPDGRLLMTLEVCDDHALRAWLLGFGSRVRVLQPKSLASAILADLEEARALYAPRMEFEPPVSFDRRAQRVLPFAGRRPGTRRRSWDGAALRRVTPRNPPEA
jgi:predicted DNA-binding transcriptional regulator YafY